MHGLPQHDAVAGRELPAHANFPAHEWSRRTIVHRVPHHARGVHGAEHGVCVVPSQPVPVRTRAQSHRGRIQHDLQPVSQYQRVVAVEFSAHDALPAHQRARGARVRRVSHHGCVHRAAQRVLGVPPRRLSGRHQSEPRAIGLSDDVPDVPHAHGVGERQLHTPADQSREPQRAALCGLPHGSRGDARVQLHALPYAQPIIDGAGPPRTQWLSMAEQRVLQLPRLSAQGVSMLVAGDTGDWPRGSRGHVVGMGRSSERGPTACSARPPLCALSEWLHNGVTSGLALRLFAIAANECHAVALFHLSCGTSAIPITASCERANATIQKTAESMKP